MSIAQNFPIVSPALSLDFAAVQALDPRISFSRASTATYYGTRTALAEQNLLLQSQTFDNASWGKIGSTVTADSTAAPDGNTTADTIVADGASSSHYITQSFTAGATQKVLSVFLKAGTNNFAQIWNSSDSNGFVNFDLSSGTVGTVGSSFTASIVSVGNGWYRCIAITSSAAANTFAIAIVSSGTAVRNETNALATTIFAWGAQLEQRSTVTAYTPTTTQPITNYIPVLETAASGVARFDHNPTTFESLGLLVEQQSTNLLTYSDDFSNAAWTKTAVTIQSNVLVAPDGTLTMDKLVPDTGTQFSTVNTSYTPTTAIHAYSVYAKKAENRYLQLMVSAASSGYVNFDLELGTVSASSLWSGSIQSVGNGLYRCIAITNALLATASTWRVVVVPSGTSARAASITGDGYSGLYIWGAQLEALALSTSYIPTVASQVTRAADSASMTGTNFSSWYAQGEGTLYVESLSQNTVAANPKNLRLSDGTTSNEIWLGNGSPGTSARSQIILGGVDYFSGSVANQVTAGQFGKYAVAFETNNAVLCANGTLGTVDTAVVISSAINQFAINPPGLRAGYYKKIAYYPIAATSAQLQALTG